MFTSHAATATVVTKIFFSQMAMLSPRGPQQMLDSEDAHVDSHTEKNEGGCENEGEISEKLKQRISLATFKRWFLVWTAMAANARIQRSTIAERITVSA
jgi:hypothetical protein